MTGSIVYSSTGSTNGDVTATISFNKTGVVVTNNGGSQNYLFTGNGSFTFEFVDAYGNTGTTTASVHWIDKTPVIGTITYSSTTLTGGPVTATIGFNKL